MNKKLAVIVISIFISLISISSSYAIDVLNKEEYLEYWYDPIFSDIVFVGDNEVDVEIADVSALIISDDLLEVSITNAYPGYIAYIDYNITNVGDPVSITGLSYSISDSTALSLSNSGITPGTILVSGEIITGSLVVTILSSAYQNSYYTFDVFIDFGEVDT